MSTPRGQIARGNRVFVYTRVCLRGARSPRSGLRRKGADTHRGMRAEVAARPGRAPGRGAAPRGLRPPQRPNPHPHPGGGEADQRPAGPPAAPRGLEETRQSPRRSRGARGGDPAEPRAGRRRPTEGSKGRPPPQGGPRGRRGRHRPPGPRAADPSRSEGRTGGRTGPGRRARSDRPQRRSARTAAREAPPGASAHTADGPAGATATGRGAGGPPGTRGRPMGRGAAAPQGPAMPGSPAQRGRAAQRPPFYSSDGQQPG